MEVALLILAIGLLTTMPIAVQLLGRVREASTLERASSTATAVLDSLGQLRYPSAGSVTRDGVSLGWIVQPAGSVIRIELHAGWSNGRRPVVDTFIAFTGAWPRRLHGLP